MVPGVYTQVYIHVVFSPHLHCPVKSIRLQERLFKFTSGVINHLGHKSLAVNGVYDHIHILYSSKPSIDISSTVKEVKRVSSKFLHEEGLMKKFDWQGGFASFSYSQSDINNVIKYIINQREHHKTKSFRTEYIEFLKAFGIDYDPRYIFEFHDENNHLTEDLIFPDTLE